MKPFSQMISKILDIGVKQKLCFCLSNGIRSLQHLSRERDELFQVDPSHDDIFFFRTLEAVGGLVKDDIKMGALFCTLILATPGATLSEASKVPKFSIILKRFLVQPIMILKPNVSIHL